MISLNDLDSFTYCIGSVGIQADRARAMSGETPIEDRGWWLYTFTVQVERKVDNYTVGRILPPSTRLKTLFEQAGVATEWVPSGDPEYLQGELNGDPSSVLEHIREVISSCRIDELYTDRHPEQWGCNRLFRPTPPTAPHGQGVHKMQERINNAANTMDLVVSDLRAAVNEIVARPTPPQGVSMADKALGQCLIDARKLQAALVMMKS